MSLFLLALIAAFTNLVLGYVWHGPLFGRRWAVASGMPQDKMTMDASMKRGMYIRMAINFVAGYVMAFVTFLFLFNFQAMSLGSIFMILGVIFVGFILPHLVVTNLWNGRPGKDSLKLFGISLGYQIINLAIWALVFAWLG